MAYEEQQLAALFGYLSDLGRAHTHAERIDAARKLANAARVLEHDVIGDARQAGITWQAIGEIHGISRQGAFRRFTSHEALVRDVEEAARKS